MLNKKVFNLLLKIIASLNSLHDICVNLMFFPLKVFILSIDLSTIECVKYASILNPLAQCANEISATMSLKYVGDLATNNSANFFF